ncbi:MAG: transcription antitermination factor NusB [Patescibacteria group bacterium]
MASRHLSRALVLQTLFESDLTNALQLADAKKILKRNASEFSLGDSDMVFADALLTGIIVKQDEIDAVIIKAAPQWPLAQIAPVDRNVLRIGLYELLFADRAAVPPKVALNEAIEIAKSFGGDASGKFVNGVLGAVYRDIGEPQKYEAPKSEPGKESLGGAVVVANVDGAPQVALIKDAFGRWTLPKKKCVEGEISELAAKRAIKEELGIDATIVAPLREHTYRANDPELGAVDRTVAYFVAKTPAANALKCVVCEGIVEARWFSPEALPGLPIYDDLRAIIDAGIVQATA